jgi:hypothetical protein
MLLLARVWIVASLCSLAFAQVRVAGRVTNENDLPVPGALVTVEDIPLTKAWEAISDPNGVFLLQLPSAGPYSFKVDREGFYVVSKLDFTVPATPLDAPPFEVHISLQSTHELRSTIEVKGEAGLNDMDRVSPQTTLSSRTLYDVPFPNSNSLRSGFRMAPGVMQDTSGGIHLFGGSEDQAEYSLEGFQLNDPLTGQFQARLSLEAVESVDIQASPSDADRGWGDAGTMLLHPRTGTDDFKFSATEYFPSVALGSGLRISNWTPRAYFSGPLRKHRAWFFNTVEFQFTRTTLTQLPEGQNSAKNFRFNDLLHNQFNLSEKNILFVGILFDYQYSPQSGLTILDPRETTVRRQSNQWFGYIKDQHSFSHSSMIEFGFAGSLTHSTAIPQGFAPYLITPDGREGNYYADARRDAHRLEGIANYYLPAFHLFGQHQLKTGGDLVRLDYEQNITRTAIDYLNTAGVMIRSITFAGSGQLTQNNSEGAVFLQDSWRVRPWLMIEAAWRADADRLLGHITSAPRAGFTLSPPGMETLRISGSFARIVDPANLQTFSRPLDQSSISSYYNESGALIYGPVTSIYTLSNNLQSPRADVWALGAERALPKLLRAKVELLERRFSDGLNYVNILPSEETFPAVLAGASNPGPIIADYLLTNQRQDHYESVEISLGQPVKGRFQWMVSYTRSSAESNAVIQRTVDQPLSVSADTGPLPWDAPNRLLSWGYLPTWSKSWSFGYMLDFHTGLPFSTQDQYGQLVGAVDSRRLPAYFEFNLFIERILSLRGYRLATRVGFNNITGHFNPTVVDNVVGGATFLREYNGQPRSLNFQIRFLGRR